MKTKNRKMNKNEPEKRRGSGVKCGMAHPERDKASHHAPGPGGERGVSQSYGREEVVLSHRCRVATVRS